MKETRDVILKVRDRKHDIMRFLGFWLDTFSSDRYNVYIWDDTSKSKIRDLIGDYPATVLTKKTFEHRDEVQNLVNSSHVTLGWSAAAFAHFATFYIGDSPYFWNIDADDMKFKKNCIRDLQTIERCVEASNIFAASWDLYWSKNLAFPKHPHHWSFGVCYVERDIDYLPHIASFSPEEGEVPPWAINVDVLFEYAKKYRKVKSFLFENELEHLGQSSRFINGVVGVRHRAHDEWIETAPYEDVIML